MKFKVFDKEKKEFVKGHYLISREGHLVSPIFDKGIGYYSLVFSTDNLIPIFSTDQKDIEGNEIYEGDECEDDLKTMKFKIGYKRGCYYWGRDPLFIWRNNLKIIGSIYTNPELLEEPE